MRSRVQRRNPASLLEDLMEPVARQARRRAVEATQDLVISGQRDAERFVTRPAGAPALDRPDWRGQWGG